MHTIFGKSAATTGRQKSFSEAIRLTDYLQKAVPGHPEQKKPLPGGLPGNG